MAFAVGRVLSWSGFWGFLRLFSIFVVKRWLVGVMVQGGHAEGRKVAYGMTGCREEVMPERRKKAYGMTGCREKVMPEGEKWHMV